MRAPGATGGNRRSKAARDRAGSIRNSAKVGVAASHSHAFWFPSRQLVSSAFTAGAPATAACTVWYGSASAAAVATSREENVPRESASPKTSATNSWVSRRER